MNEVAMKPTEEVRLETHLMTGAKLPMIHARIAPTLKARMAQAIAEQLCRGGNVLIREAGPEYIARLACNLADELHKQYGEREWLLELPIADPPEDPKRNPFGFGHGEHRE